jgi:hypothetical protein
MSHLFGNSQLKDPTGFLSPDDVVVTYSPSARTVTLTGNLSALWQGKDMAAVNSNFVNGGTWVSAAHTSTVTSTMFLYYDGTGFIWSNTAWTFDYLMICAVVFDANGTYFWALREVHGTMPWSTHRECHLAIGTMLIAGADLAGYTPGSTVAAERRPSVATATIQDEDLRTTVAQIADNGPYQIMALSTPSTTFTASNGLDILTLQTTCPTLGAKVQVVTAGGTLPSPLAASTDYYVIPAPNISPRTCQLAASYADAIAGNAIGLTTDGVPTNVLLFNGSSANAFMLDHTEIIPVSGNQPYYNQFVPSYWTQTLFTAGQYGKIFIMASPVAADGSSYGEKRRYVFIQPQTVSTNLATIQALVPSSLNLGSIATQATEYCFVGEIIVRYNAANWTIISAAKLTGTRVSQVSLTGVTPSNPAVAFSMLLQAGSSTLLTNHTTGTPSGGLGWSGGGPYVATVTHNLGLTNVRDVIVQCFNSSGVMVPVSIGTFATNSFVITSATTADMWISVQRI